MPSVGLYLGIVQFFFAASWIIYVLYLPQLAAQAGIGKAAVAWILMADQLVFVFADYASGVAADRVSRAVGRIGLWVLAATLVSCAAFLALPFVAPGTHVVQLGHRKGWSYAWHAWSACFTAPRHFAYHEHPDRIAMQQGPGWKDVERWSIDVPRLERVLGRLDAVWG